jgi:hypothetical protein
MPSVQEFIEITDREIEVADIAIRRTELEILVRSERVEVFNNADDDYIS